MGPRSDEHNSIYLPYELLSSVSSADWLKTHVPSEGKATPKMGISDIHCLAVLGLLVQWLYTGKYEELSGLSHEVYQDSRPRLGRRLDLDPRITMDCPVKAAILAWLLGEELCVPEFQNHAITRLFAALARQSEHPQLTPGLYSFVCGNAEESGELTCALEDLIVRDWGDASVVDQEDLTEWAPVISGEDRFSKKFFEGSILSLEQRREKAIMAEAYFVDGHKSTREPTPTVVRKE